MDHPLHLCLPEIETLNPDTLEFGVLGGQEIDLEYSLYTISLWESKWKKPFIEATAKLTREEEIGLYEAMCITPNIDRLMWSLITPPLKEKIFKYMGDPMSATTVNSINKRSGKREIVTSELVYYWMSSNNIPYSCEHWHFNRLMKLIEVCFIKQTPPKKRSKRETAQMYKDLNAQRLAKYNTKG